MRDIPLSIASIVLAKCQRVEKVWGTEFILVNEPEYCVKILALKSGCMSSLHYHRKKKETFIVLHGSCFMQVAGVSKVIKESDRVLLNPLVQHKFWSPRVRRATACYILEASTHHDDKDVVRLEPSRVIDPQAPSPKKNS